MSEVTDQPSSPQRPKRQRGTNEEDGGPEKKKVRTSTPSVGTDQGLAGPVSKHKITPSQQVNSYPATGLQTSSLPEHRLPSLSMPPLSYLQAAGSERRGAPEVEPLAKVRKETHNATERRRRDRIRERLQDLKEAIPSCTSSKKIDILTEAIVYIRTLEARYEDLLTRSLALELAYVERGGDTSYLSPYKVSQPHQGLQHLPPRMHGLQHQVGIPLNPHIHHQLPPHLAHPASQHVRHTAVVHPVACVATAYPRLYEGNARRNGNMDADNNGARPT